jgi:hypothetical protein
VSADLIINSTCPIFLPNARVTQPFAEILNHGLEEESDFSE